MSRSKQKLPIFGNANGSEKRDKRFANRAVRVKVKTLLANGEDVVDLDTRMSATCTASRKTENATFRMRRRNGSGSERVGV